MAQSIDLKHGSLPKGTLKCTTSTLKNLCPGGKDDHRADHNCCCSSQKVAPRLDGRQEHLSSRRMRRGVHDPTTQLRITRTPERRVPSQEASLRPQTRTMYMTLEDHAISSSDPIHLSTFDTSRIAQLSSSFTWMI